MKMMVGHVPNLPWWRALDMSDAEIKEFNNKHLTVIEMKDDNLSDAQSYDDTFAKLNAKMGFGSNSVGKPSAAYVAAVERAVGCIENVYAKQIWNAAIDAAAKVIDEGFPMHADDIRKLKK